MARLSDVALALQLHAELRSDQPEVTVVRRKTSHSRWRSNTAEEWRRGKCLGEGGYGQVYLEECISGGTIGSVRAVKKLQKARSEDYHHELNALALFSLGKVGQVPFIRDDHSLIPMKVQRQLCAMFWLVCYGTAHIFRNGIYAIREYCYRQRLPISNAEF